MKKLVVFGAGKIAQIVSSYFSRMPDVEIVAYTCDASHMSTALRFANPIYPYEEIADHLEPRKHHIFIALGYQEANTVRAQRLFSAFDLGFKPINCIAASNLIDVNVGINCFVAPGAVCQPHSTIGDNAFLWDQALVGHHARVGDHAWLSGGCSIGGGATLGSHCFLGLNAIVSPQITIGERTIIGAGAMVTKDATSDSVFIEPATAKHRLNCAQFLRFTKTL